MTPELSSASSTPASDSRYRATFEQSALGMGQVSVPHAGWIDVNKSFCELLGRSQEEVLSLRWKDITRAEDVPSDEVLFSEMAAGKLDSHTVQKIFLHSDGHHVWTKLTLSLVRDGSGQPDYAVAVIEDIRDRIQADMEFQEGRLQLEKERARLQTIVDTIPTGLIMMDEDGTLLIENDEWKRTWAKSSSENFVDYDSYKGFRPDTGQKILGEEWPCAMSLKQGVRTRDVILDIERFNGTHGTIVVSSAPILDDAGRVVGAVAANMDITELRNAQAQLLDADRRKDEFLAMLSHELRNPLAPIRNSLHLLDRVDPAGPQALKARETIGRQVTHLTHLVDDLLDVTRIANGKIELQRKKLDLAELVKRTADDYRIQIQERGLQLSVSVLEEPLIVDGDETRLAQVVGNLLTNAAKYTPSGGHIELTVKSEPGRAVVCVEDTGIGIASELLPTIFEPFIQAVQGLARTDGGLGLGLALVKGVAEMHGGSVLAKSTLGAGTEFVVQVPLAGLHESSQNESPTLAKAGSSKYRVLVVDDNPDCADTLASLVEMLGYAVEVAYDGNSAVSLAEAKHHDVVLCDIGLPGMNGYEVAQTLRKKLPAITRMFAISGYAQAEDVRKSLEAGFNAHFAKPFDIQNFQHIFGEHAYATQAS